MIPNIYYDAKRKLWHNGKGTYYPLGEGSQFLIGGKRIQFNSDGTKTIVEYPDKTKNYDTSHKGKYIQYIENSDSAGYINGKWYAEEYYNPYAKKHKLLNSKGQIKRVYDPNQIGIGLDMRPKNNTIILKYLKRDNKGTYISKSDEHYVRQRSIRDKDEALQRNLKGLKLSPNKEAMALGMFYHGNGKFLFNPNGPETRKLNNTMLYGTDKDFYDAIYNFYKTRNTDRANKHKEYWSGKLASGGTLGLSVRALNNKFSN